MLGSCDVVTFLATTNASRAKGFYRETLGLKFVSEDEYALVFDANGITLRISPVKEFTPDPFTVLGWLVEDITGKARELVKVGVKFERYPYFEQDELGIWTAPGSGAKVAWFKDPDGNLLSIGQV